MPHPQNPSSTLPRVDCSDTCWTGLMTLKTVLLVLFVSLCVLTVDAQAPANATQPAADGQWIREHTLPVSFSGRWVGADAHDVIEITNVTLAMLEVDGLCTMQRVEEQSDVTFKVEMLCDTEEKTASPTEIVVTLQPDNHMVLTFKGEKAVVYRRLPERKGL